jgi:ribonuclease VapC
VSRVELGIVAQNKEVAAEVNALLDALKVNIAAFDHQQATLALAAFARYGKGRHPAALNFGDCCAYALAKSMNLPLLYKGNDFAQTDIASALA